MSTPRRRRTETHEVAIKEAEKLIVNPKELVDLLVQANVLEKFKQLGFSIGTAGVLYGYNNTGKTLITFALALQLMKEYNINPLFIVTEGNWFMNYEGTSLYSLAKELFGEKSVIPIAEPYEIFLIDYPEDTFIVVDSLGAIHLRAYREAFKTLAQVKAKKKEKAITLIVSREVVPLINSIVDHVVSEAILKHPNNPSTVVFIAHACREVTELYKDVAEARPSFGARAGHSLIWEMFLPKRFEVVLVSHRFKGSLVGTKINLLT